jgi:hypothetical protein
MTSAADKNPPQSPTLLTAEERPWPVKALTVLLFVQSVGLLTLAVYNFITLDLGQALVTETLIALLFGTAAGSLAFSALSLLALVAALGFFGLWRTAWLNGMVVQGLMLFIALVMYFQGERLYTFVMMVYGIFMVIYLHHPDVQATFRPNVTPDGLEEVL